MSEIERTAWLSDGCLCQGCGWKFRVDVLIPDALWNKIRPPNKPEGAGLLCGSCIGARIEAIGDFNAFALAPIEPDEATVEEMARAMANELFDELNPAWFEESERKQFIANTAPTLLRQARAAYLAGVGRKEHG